MQVSVVIPTFRRPELLARCLAALSRQRFPAGEFEVIVADDAASDQTHRQLEELSCGSFHPVYVPVVGRHGPAAARNVGWRAARGSIIAFTDDDCIPDSGWLAAGLESFVDPAVVAVTGQTIVPLPPEPTDHERNVAGLENSEFLTANCFCRREVLLALGGFDERFTTAWREDSDLHFRLLDLGGNIRRVTSAVVVHPVRQAVWGISLREQRKAFFEALLFRKHPRHFRERIHPTCPWEYYGIAAAALIAVIAAARGHLLICLTATAIWLGLSLSFCLRRMRGTSRSPGHLSEMAITSLVIPFLSIFWRLCGAVRFRVFFW